MAAKKRLPPFSPDWANYREGRKTGFAEGYEAAADDMLPLLEELQESATYWSEYDVPLGIVDRINEAIYKVKKVLQSGATARGEKQDDCNTMGR